MSTGPSGAHAPGKQRRRQGAGTYAAARREAGGPGRVYLVGGASAGTVGWRQTTVDVAPEPAGVFEAIARAKDALDINIELAVPDADGFIPPLPDWQARSPFIVRHGGVGFYAQALAKVERGHALDRRDVAAMHARGLIDPDRLSTFFDRIEPGLLRYPAIDPHAFRAKVDAAVAALLEGGR